MFLHVQDATLHVAQTLRGHLGAELGDQVLAHRRKAVGIADLAGDDLGVSIMSCHASRGLVKSMAWQVLLQSLHLHGVLVEERWQSVQHLEHQHPLTQTCKQLSHYTALRCNSTREYVPAPSSPLRGCALCSALFLVLGTPEYLPWS